MEQQENMATLAQFPEPPEPDRRTPQEKEDSGKNRLAWIIVGIVVLVSAVFYFVYKPSYLPAIQIKSEEKMAAGIVSRVGENSFDISTVVDGVKKTITFKVDKDTAFFRIDFVKNKQAETAVVFKFIKENQNVGVIYEKGWSGNMAKKVELLNLLAPQLSGAEILDYPTIPPSPSPGAGN